MWSSLALVDARSVLVGDLNAGRKSRIRRSEPQVVGIGSQIPGYDPVPSISKVVDYLLANVRVCLHDSQPGAVTREVEAGERFRFRELDIHAEKVDACDTGAGQQIIQRDGADRSLLPRRVITVRERLIGRRHQAIAAWHEQGLERIRAVAHEKGKEFRARSVLCVAGCEFLLRIDGHAGPPEFLLEVIGVAETFVVVGTNVEEYTAPLIVKEVADYPFLRVLGMTVWAICVLEPVVFCVS